jgi:hypothetical protein
MVPADDEHKSANEAEKNTSTQRNFVEKLKFWKRRDEDEHEPARLKTLPKCLMHWTTPVWIAAAGFLIALAFAVNWRGESHWPTAEAMKLCATIAGAGFAFSAWQQRSHDNVVNAKQAQATAKQAQATAEREDYWKRREHIYQLLGSKNPGLRLSAVALLAELADSAAHSTLLNETEKQQLQRHIIDTLCLQVRHEGVNIPGEGTRSEHAEIQKEILRIILNRIDSKTVTNQHANWTNEDIILDNAKIYPSITIIDRSINTNISLDNSIIYDHLKIQDSEISSLNWRTATCRRSLTIQGKSKRCIISMDAIPRTKTIARFNNLTIVSTRNGFFINLTETSFTRPQITFENCKFIHTPRNASTNSADDNHIRSSEVTIIDISDKDDNNRPYISFTKCSMSGIFMTFKRLLSPIVISKCQISDYLNLIILSTPPVPHSRQTGLSNPYINIHDNIFIANNTNFIHCTPEELIEDQDLISIKRNHFSNGNIFNTTTAK